MNHASRLLLVLLLPGCAPTVCDQAQDWAERCRVDWTDADTRACRDQLKSCSGQERKALDAYWACLDGRKFFTCDASNDTGAAGATAPGAEDLLACRPELEGVSIACTASIGIEGGEFAGLSSGSTTSEPTP